VLLIEIKDYSKEEKSGRRVRIVIEVQIILTKSVNISQNCGRNKLRILYRPSCTVA